MKKETIGIILMAPLAIIILLGVCVILLMPLIAAITSGSTFGIVASIILYVGLIGFGILNDVYSENKNEN
jgi:hypothetical protein